IAYPYEGVPSLWIFYNYHGNLAMGIAQPSSSASTFHWAQAQTIAGWTQNAMNPQLTGAPAAAVFTYTDPKTLTSHSAPYVVFVGSGGSDLDYVYYDSSSDTWVGNDNISITKGYKLFATKANSNPCLAGFPRIGNLPGIGVLLYAGDYGSSI